MTDTLDLEGTALGLINLARAARNEDLGLELPPLDRAPRTNGDLHRALDCLGVRRPTGELLFDRSVWKTALACARAWAADYFAHDYASLEFNEGEIALIKCVAVMMPESLAEFARLHGLGSDDI
ncbi:MAG: hypothetical protein ACJ74Q_15640 [Pyrinomonadaceae bacterium]